MPHATPQFLLARIVGLVFLISVYLTVAGNREASPVDDVERQQSTDSADVSQFADGVEDASAVLQAWIDRVVSKHNESSQLCPRRVHRPL